MSYWFKSGELCRFALDRPRNRESLDAGKLPSESPVAFFFSHEEMDETLVAIAKPIFFLYSEGAMLDFDLRRSSSVSSASSARL